jgi:hypothetical protein
MSGVTLYSGTNYTGTSYKLPGPGRYQCFQSAGPRDNTTTLIPFKDDTLKSFTASDDLIVILCDNCTPGSGANFFPWEANYTKCTWYSKSQPDTLNPTEDNAYHFGGNPKTKDLIPYIQGTTTIIVYNKNNYDNDFCQEGVSRMPISNCKKPPPPPTPTPPPLIEKETNIGNYSRNNLWNYDFICIIINFSK